jgi:hypothetical protein
MAHTLKAYYYTDPATAVTVDFMGAVTGTTGIAVDSYQMGIPGIEQARNNSLYSDSPRPVYSKHGMVTDVLTVTVRGSTNTVLYTNLHLLAKLGEYARLGAQNGTNCPSAYLQLKPGGSAVGEVLYAVIYDCRVELPADWAMSQDATLMIEDVTVTIERGLWRSQTPGISYIDNNISVTNQPFASSASSSLSIGGDASALIRLTVNHGTLGTKGQMDRVIVGYRSLALGGSSYNALGKKEAESATLGTDTSAVADATASGGNVARCTQTTAPSTPAVRVSGAVVPRGMHRVFARMKITGTAVSSVYLRYSDESVANGGVFTPNTAVLVSSTSWLVYDMGIVRALDVPGTVVYGTYQVYSSLSSGAGNLDIDWVYLMPTEGYITAQGLGITTSAPDSTRVFEYQNGIETNTTCICYLASPKATAKPAYTASISPPPGACALYWLIGTDSGSVFDVGIFDSAEIGLYTVPRYLMPSVV